MKILIITRDFGNNFWIYGWLARMTELANFLARKNYSVHVLCVKRRKTWKMTHVHDGVNVKEIRSGSTYWQVMNPKLFDKIVRKILFLFEKKIYRKKNVDSLHPYIKRFKKKAISVIEKEKIDCVVISSPPHSLQLLVKSLRERFGNTLTIVSDYRDPWTAAARYRPSNKKLLEQYESMQKTVSDNADLTTTVSEGLANSICDITGKKADVVYNGFSLYSVSRLKKIVSDSDKISDKFISTAHSNGRLVLAFAGSGLYGDESVRGKNLSPVINRIAEDEYLSKSVSILLQGEIRCERELPGGLDYVLLPPTSNDEVLKNLLKVDVGLNIYTEPFDAHVVFGGKTNDYISVFLPVWFVFPNNADAIRKFVAETHGLSIFTDCDDPEAITKALRQLVVEYQSGNLKERAIVGDIREWYSRENQYELMLAKIRHKINPL